MEGFQLEEREAPYTTPSFPSLHWSAGDDNKHTLENLRDMWLFILLWTLIIYALFHLGASTIALAMQVGKKKSNWKYLWMVPIIYLVVAGLEALFAGSIVGLIVGAIYHAGHYRMSTWIPFVWGWINVLVLIVSSFSIQGGL